MAEKGSKTILHRSFIESVKKHTIKCSNSN